MYVLQYGNRVDDYLFKVQITDRENLDKYLEECKEMMTAGDWYDNEEVFKYIVMTHKKETYQQWFGSFCDLFDLLVLGFEYGKDPNDDEGFDVKFIIDENTSEGDIYVSISSSDEKFNGEKLKWCQYTIE